MKVTFYGDIEGLEDGIRALSGRLGIVLSDDGFPVHVEKRAGDLQVSQAEGEGKIRFDRTIHFYRALGRLVEELRLQGAADFAVCEEPQFRMNGIMIDCSRNSVLKAGGLRQMIEIMALMGLDTLMLYTEDTYTLEDNPYFGYMRGRYTQEELKAADDYADQFGIEMIPCIQTLAHLKAALKWNFAKDIRDTEDILLAGSEQTYAFVDEMIRAASAPFRSRRIHIGMDEAHHLGLGAYLDQNGFRNRFEIMNEHLGRVKGIAEKYGLQPMMWSDMYFRLASPTGNYYDLDHDVPEDVVKRIPEGVQLVYWDYYHNDVETYRKLIRKHMKVRREGTVFAGGLWTWNGVTVRYDKALLATNAALAACKKEGLQEVFATLWGDDGSETNVFTGLPGMQLYAEHGYSASAELDPERFRRRLAFCTGGSYEAFLQVSSFDHLPVPESYDILPSNPSKFLLWQDVLLGLFDKHAALYDFPVHYVRIAEALEKAAAQGGEWRLLLDQSAKLAAVLSLKSQIGLRITEAYRQNDRKELEELARVRLSELYDRVRALRKAHRELWFATYKPNGWEVLDIRYGGLLARIESAQDRISDYIRGDVHNLEELEEERLFFDGPERDVPGRVIGFCAHYHRIATAGSMVHN